MQICRQIVRWMFCAIIVGLLPTDAFADFLCGFPLQSTVEGNSKMDGQGELEGRGFRVVRSGEYFKIEMRTANGDWSFHDDAVGIIGGEFTIFLGLPAELPDMQTVNLLTIHSSGSASLLTHYGDFGNSSQIRSAWLYYGQCKRTSP